MEEELTHRFLESLRDMRSNESSSSTDADFDAAIHEFFRVLALVGGEGEAGVDLCHVGMGGKARTQTPVDCR